MPTDYMRADRSEIDVEIVSKSAGGGRISVFELAAVSDGRLPPWTPGSHIELRWKSDDSEYIRPYSLCGESLTGPRWRIAVLRERDGRGGSAYLCDQAQVGTRLQACGPRNHFPFTPDRRVTFLAAGIGITPILPMAFKAEAEGVDWRLMYLVRERSDVSLRRSLDKLPKERITMHCAAEVGRLCLDEWASALGTGDSVFACGPRHLLDAIVAIHSARPSWKLHFERFQNPDKDTGQADAFDVVLARSGKTFRVQPTESILDVFRRNGVSVEWCCGDGVCGTCEQRVLQGTPDHRDAVLTPEQRQSNCHIMICVSRSVTPSLTLDL